MSDLTVQWKSEGKWVNFDITDLSIKTRETACHLFVSEKIDVVAKEGGEYFVSNNSLLKKYKKQGARVRTFASVIAAGGDLLREPFHRVGFGLVAA